MILPLALAYISLLLVCFMEESPKFYISIRKYREARMVLHGIAKRNHVNLGVYRLHKEVEVKSRTFSFIEEVRDEEDDYS